MVTSFPLLRRLLVIFLSLSASECANWTPIIVKSVREIGPQLTPNLTNVSRDGGHSVMINRKIVWLYDDTECLSNAGKQLSFVSNTAAYASNLDSGVDKVQDFGIERTGYDQYGGPENAILGFGAVGDGGWIPFENGEVQYNEDHVGKERVAIWPGTAPVPIDQNTALLFAPLVYVDPKPINPARHYVPRGMTLVTITASPEGPKAVRESEGLVFPGDSIQFGGFAAILGYPSIELQNQNPRDDRDIYVLGAGAHGLQLARTALDTAQHYEAYKYWTPGNQTFVMYAPSINTTDEKDIYLPGSYSSGTLFYSPYFKTFLLVYFNALADSKFWIRYLDLFSPIDPKSKEWPTHGRNGKGIEAEDAEALLHYNWSDQQLLYQSKPKPGGFNYAGSAHPEYFNRAYYPVSDFFYPRGQVFGDKRGDWIGQTVVPEGQAGGDGRNLLLSWTAQLHGGPDTGKYQIELAVVTFGGSKNSSKPDPKDWVDGYFGPWKNQAAGRQPWSVSIWFSAVAIYVGMAL